MSDIGAGKQGACGPNASALPAATTAISAALMPTIASGNTNSTTLMMTKKAAGALDRARRLALPSQNALFSPLRVSYRSVLIRDFPRIGKSLTLAVP
jgi:hypothetical protein